MIEKKQSIGQFVKNKRKELGLTQEQFAQRVGVGLRFCRDVEQGKPTLRMDKLNQLLNYLGYELGVVEMERKE